MEQIAHAAGVSRQTVYAHFHTRDALVEAVTDAVAGEVAAELDEARLDEVPATDALRRLLDASWAALQRYPHLMTAASRPRSRSGDARHEGVSLHLARIIDRGQQSGEFSAELPTAWLSTAIITLGHAAGDAIADGQLAPDEAARVLLESARRLCGAATS